MTSPNSASAFQTLENIAEYLRYRDPGRPSVVTDRWVLLSALQKAIRRCEVKNTIGFGLSLMALDEVAFWRRLKIIAAEDIGIGSTQTVLEIAVVSASPKWRRQHGPERVATLLLERIAKAPKSRMPDHTAMIAKHHLLYRETRLNLFRMAPDALTDVLLGESQDGITKAMAAWFLSGPARTGNEMPPLTTKRHEVLELLPQMGISGDLLDGCGLLLKGVAEPILLMLPILAHASRDECHKLVERKLCQQTYQDVPLYALDPLHTRGGKSAIIRWREACRPLQGYTIRQLAKGSFDTEGIALGLERACKTSETIKRQGIEASLLDGGLPTKDHAELLWLVEQHKDELSAIREEIVRANRYAR